MVLKKIKALFNIIKEVNIWKTVYFNIHYFPFKTAVCMPVFVYRRSELFKMKGNIILNAPAKPGLVKFGSHGLGTQDLLYSRTMWEVYGTLIINGNVCIGRGSKISIGNNATLTLGRNFMITGNSEIICQKSITFGDDCLLSWDILIMDTDFHHVLDDKGNSINSPKPIKIGNHVWIGCRNTILKGVTIADHNIVSANSTITKSLLESGCVIGGHGKSVGILKRGIDWKL